MTVWTWAGSVHGPLSWIDLQKRVPPHHAPGNVTVSGGGSLAGSRGLLAAGEVDVRCNKREPPSSFGLSPVLLVVVLSFCVPLGLAMVISLGSALRYLKYR